MDFDAFSKKKTTPQAIRIDTHFVSMINMTGIYAPRAYYVHLTSSVNHQAKHAMQLETGAS